MVDKSKKKSASRKPAGAEMKRTSTKRSEDPAARKRSRPSGPLTRQHSDDWQRATLERMRELIRQAAPDAVEEAKWRKPSNGMQGVPVWSDHGIICTGETYKDKVKLTFARGAAIEDPDGLFNASLDAGTRRAIDIREGEKVNSTAFKALVRRAVAANRLGEEARAGGKGSKARNPATSAAAAHTTKKKAAGGPSHMPGEVALLSGGNPQIPKGDGDAPVQQYIAAIPGWKRDVAREVDRLVAEVVPKVRKAVRWNSPFYGVEGQGWFLSFHCFERYLKLTFFKGGSLQPPPPEKSKYRDVRYLHVCEGERIDGPQMTAWIHQAAALPGESLFS